MIHYTLLPQKELKSLKREYKTRFFVTLSFFISCAVMVGIGSLVPTFILSKAKEKNTLSYIESIKRENNEINSVITSLSTTTNTLKKIKANYQTTDLSKNIYEISAGRNSQIFITSFKFGDFNTASSTTDIIIQGKAVTRDSLIDFKKSMEDNPKISGLQLPVSDLAKSKDISFSMRFNMKK